jgi:hypothetical protein
MYEEFTKQQLEELTNLEKTYVRKLNRVIKQTNVADVITKIKNYDLNKFICKHNHGIYNFYPNETFINLVKEFNSTITDNEVKIEPNFVVSISVLPQLLNQIDITDGIPESLRGLGFAYKLYKIVINRCKYITSNKHSSFAAQNIWYNLMTDADLMCFTSNFLSGVMVKNISDEEIKNLLNRLPNTHNEKINKNIQITYVFDDYLKTKIDELFDSKLNLNYNI